jgi:hypothetical protein
MVLWEICFRHGLCEGVTRKQHGSRRIGSPQGYRVAVAQAANTGPDRGLVCGQNQCFSGLRVADLRLGSAAATLLLTGFAISRAAANSNAAPWSVF